MEDQIQNPLNKSLNKLVELISRENKDKELRQRHEKIRQILLLLGKGTALATTILMPNSARLFKDISIDKSDWNAWKIFNKDYLKRTLRKLEKQKMVEVKDMGDHAVIVLAEKGKQKILKFGLETLAIGKPAHWDGKWRIVFYDVLDGKRKTRDKFRSYLVNAGFYPLQESDFLKNFLGIGAEVRIVIAEKIENDDKFRDYFGLP